MGPRPWLFPVLVGALLLGQAASQGLPALYRQALSPILPPGVPPLVRRLEAARRVPGLLGGPPRGGAPRPVALTFDDGPYPLYTPLLLEVLRRHSVKATFFVTGQAVRQYPQLARQIAADGHELANHTFTHRRGSELSEAELAQEILDTEQALREVVGVVPSLFRPAGGNLSRAQQALVGRLGYTTVLYTVNPGDWWVRDPEEVSELTMSGRQEEGVILLHSGSMSTLRALPGVLARLRQRGLAPVTVGRLAQARGLTLPANPRELPALAAKPQPPGETLFQRFLQGLVASTRPPAEGRTPQAGRALPRAD